MFHLSYWKIHPCETIEANKEKKIFSLSKTKKRNFWKKYINFDKTDTFNHTRKETAQYAWKKQHNTLQNPFCPWLRREMLLVPSIHPCVQIAITQTFGCALFSYINRDQHRYAKITPVEGSGWSLRSHSLLSTATPTLSSSLVHRWGQQQRLPPPSTWLLKVAEFANLSLCFFSLYILASQARWFLKTVVGDDAEEKTAVKSDEPSPAEEQQSQPEQRRAGPSAPAGAIPNPFDFSTMMNLLNVRCCWCINLF